MINKYVEPRTLSFITTEDTIIVSASQKFQAFLHSTNPNYSVLDVWALKNKKVNDYQLVSGYKSFFVNQLVAYLRVNKPDIFEKYSEMQISEFLKKNIVV